MDDITQRMLSFAQEAPVLASEIRGLRSRVEELTIDNRALRAALVAAEDGRDRAVSVVESFMSIVEQLPSPIAVDWSLAPAESAALVAKQVCRQLSELTQRVNELAANERTVGAALEMMKVHEYDGRVFMASAEATQLYELLKARGKPESTPAIPPPAPSVEESVDPPHPDGFGGSDY